MTYLHCAECGFTRRRGPIAVRDNCPRCKLRGRTVYLSEIQGLPRLLASAPIPADGVMRQL